MLSSDEQRIWDDIERFYAVEAEEPVLPARHPARRRRHDPHGVDDLPAAAVAGLWVVNLPVLFGPGVGGLAIGTATALGWVRWRCWP